MEAFEKMIKNTKAKGSRNERRGMAYFNSQGYSCTKSGASLGVFDFIGIGKRDIIAVQVKSNRRPSPEEIKIIRDFQGPINFKKYIMVYRDWVKDPIVEEIV